MFFHPFPLVNGPDRQTNKMKRCLLPFFRLLNGSISAAKGEKKNRSAPPRDKEGSFFFVCRRCGATIMLESEGLNEIVHTSGVLFCSDYFFFSPLCFFPSLSLNEQLYRHRVRLFHALQTKMQLSFDRSGDLPVLILTLHGRTAVESRGRFKRRIFFFSIKRTTRVLDEKPNENK